MLVSTTSVSITGRTVPLFVTNARSRASWGWSKPGTRSRVQPSLTDEVTRASVGASSVRPMLAAALTQPCWGLSTAAGAVPAGLTSEEDTYATDPLAATPTVTMPRVAGTRSPIRWRSSTARAGLCAKGWSLTSSRASTCAWLMPSRSRCALTHWRAVATAPPPLAGPSLPSAAKIDAGVPAAFHVTDTWAPRARAALVWPAVGRTAAPAPSMSASPATASPMVRTSGAAGPGAAEALFARAGSCWSTGPKAAATSARPAVAVLARREVEVMTAITDRTVRRLWPGVLSARSAPWLRGLSDRISLTGHDGSCHQRQRGPRCRCATNQNATRPSSTNGKCVTAEAMISTASTTRSGAGTPRRNGRSPAFQ